MNTRSVVEAAFSQPQKCYGHCDQMATLRILEEGDPLVACFACPAGYASKVMVYGSEDVSNVLRGFLLKATGQQLREDDVRVATRHSTDLGIPSLELRAAYWTQNYRASKSDDKDRLALFVCSNCGSTYTKPVSAEGTRCRKCLG